MQSVVHENRPTDDIYSWPNKEAVANIIYACR